MDLSSFASWLEMQSFSISIAESAWLFPTIETVHVLALTLVFGAIAMMDLRLLGVTRRNTLVTQLSAEVLPLTWAGFALAAITGLLMFASSASRYASNAPFLFKMGLLVLAGLNMALFHGSAYRRVDQWDDSLPTPAAARAAGMISLVTWTVIVILGRWIGFV